MIKYFLSIFISLLFFNQSLAKDVNINENIDLEFVCNLEKKIIKNSEYNYQTFSANDLDEKNLDKFQILSRKPDQLLVLPWNLIGEIRKQLFNVPKLVTAIPKLTIFD